LGFFHQKTFFKRKNLTQKGLKVENMQPQKGHRVHLRQQNSVTVLFLNGSSGTGSSLKKMIEMKNKSQSILLTRKKIPPLPTAGSRVYSKKVIESLLKINRLTSTHIQKKYSYGTENYSSKITRIKM
jgi:uncharacterized alpha/beta hydrolase family protein